MDVERMKKFLIRFSYYAVLLISAVLVLKFVLPTISPFVYAAVIVLCLRGASLWLSRKTKMSVPHASLVMLVLFYLIIGLVLWFAIFNLINGISDITGYFMGLFNENIAPVLEESGNNMDEFFNRIVPINLDDSFWHDFTDWLTGIMKTGIEKTGNFLTVLPSRVFDIIIMVVASIILSGSFDRILEFIKKQMSDDALSFCRKLKVNGIRAFMQYFKAYFKIICITFTELCIGLFILGQGGLTPLLAIIIAIIDIVPVLGVGTVLIPWAVIMLFAQNWFMGIGLLVLYVIIFVIRQYLEPRIVGRQIGVHPIVILLCLYIGARLFGFVGMIALPVLVSIVVQLNASGTIHLFRELD